MSIFNLSASHAHLLTTLLVIHIFKHSLSHARRLSTRLVIPIF